jgi:hypothetical protein
MKFTRDEEVCFDNFYIFPGGFADAHGVDSGPGVPDSPDRSQD